MNPIVWQALGGAGVNGSHAWGPYCTSHRSVFCADAQAAIADGGGAEELLKFIDEVSQNLGPGEVQMLTLNLPIWAEQKIWFPVIYRAKMERAGLSPVSCIEEAGNSWIPIRMRQAISDLQPGDSIGTLADGLRDMLRDEVRANSLMNPAGWAPCKASTHNLPMQRQINKMRSSSYEPKILVAIQGVLTTIFGTCYYCYLEKPVGRAATRVSTDAGDLTTGDTMDEVDPFGDLIPGDEDTTQRRR